MTLRSGTAQALDPVRSAFALAALLSVLLNFGVVVLAPLFQFECAPEPIEERTPNARRLGVPVPAAARSTPGRGQIAEAWSCLHPVDPDTLRLLPDSSALAQQARQKPRWLFFGLSSVHRKQAEYLGITLSHLFDALGDSTDTGLVIHLADFDESWVAQTQDWLKTGFEDEVQENRMHVIHAPERLYPAKAEVMKYTKYGDPPLRQWWRAKQNLDYAFLMWYAANLSEYYMQLEDDVQVTPNFLPTVRRFMHEKLTGDAWVMAAFSKLGFIGKLFHSSRLPKLAEFLLIFHGEAPCDWLVWVFIDAVSSQPVDILIPQDLEDEHNQRESAKSNPNVKLSKSMRTDVLLYYKEKKMPVFLSNPAPVIQKITPPPAPLDTAPSSASSGSLPVRARVHSTMQHWQQYAPAMAYMVSQPGVPGTSNKRGFWSSDTCHPSRTAATALCDPTKKFLQVIFDQPLHVSFLKLSMGAPDHPQDYVRNGTLEAGFELFPQDQSLCKSYIALAPVNAREVSWQGQLVHAVKCLRVRLLATQQEWVMIKFEEILEAGSSLTTVTTSSSETRNVVQATSQHLVVPILSTAAPASSAPTTAAGQPGRPTAVPANPQAAQVSPLRHRMFLRLQAYQHEDHQDVFSTMIASSVGLISGLSGWVNVFLCRRLCLEGASLVGQFPCWISGFLPVIDSLLFMSLKAPNATVQCDPLEPQERKLSRQEQTLEIPWWSNLPVRWQQAKQQATLRPSHRRLTSLTRWADLFTPARRLAANLQELLHLGFSPEQPKKWLAVGMRFKVGDGELEEPLQVVGKLLEAGGVQMLVLLHLSDETEQQRSRVLERLRQRFSEEIQAGRLLAVRAPEEHYVDQRREHYELAALFTVAGSISDFYVQVEDNIVAQSGFVKFLRDYVSEKMAVNKTTWNMISLGRDGLNRKVVRSKHLIRFAELLPIFPEVPPDSLLWDFVDVINNQSAPKACYIAFSATKMKRHDVILQYHKAEAIIEHVGDVSSLEGKVQRIHDDYFKKHNLLSSLFDNPPADIFAGFHLDPATSNQLQNLYGVHGNSQGMGGAPAVTILAQTLAEVVGKGTFEVVFKRPLCVQMINLRMGGFLRPAAKNKKQPELADPDFDFVFPDAEIALGRGRAPAGLNQSVPRGARPQVPAHGLCSVYEPLTNFSGREFFWRSPTSRPAAGVECVKVTLLEAPKSNVILRTIRIRSLKTTAAARRMTPEETAQVFQPKWQDEMRSWAKNVLVAFGSGALFGSLGFVVTMLPRIQPSKVRRRTGEVHRRGRDMVGAQNDPLCSLIHLGSC